MKRVFADTFYWIALINPRDDWHDRAISICTSADEVELVTTEEVLGELLTFYSQAGERMRRRTVIFVKSILSNTNIQVIEQTHQSFLDGLELYQDRLDKGYSLTDCISMCTMRLFSISQVLTHDRHFIQEGFEILFQ